MKIYLTSAAAAAVIFAVMDSIWFSVFMKKFAEEKLGHLLRLSGGNLSAHMPSALAAYALMIIIAVVFMLPKISVENSMLTNFLFGVLFGFCIFGIFDFTNGALLKDYSFSFMLIDSLWGGLMYGVVAVAFSKIL